MRAVLLSATMVCIGATAVAGAQQQSETFTWSAPVSSGNVIRIRNVRGDISVVPSNGRTVEVTAAKRWRRGNGDLVRVDARRVGDAISICALWGAMTTCDSPLRSADSRAAGDVVLQISVRVPAGMRLTVSTINGDVSIDTESRVLSAETVNGNVVVMSSEGTVVASTINGTVTAYLTEPVHATVDLKSRGKVHSEFPLEVTHGLKPGRIQARIGNGGRRIELTTVWGDIWLRPRGRG